MSTQWNKLVFGVNQYFIEIFSYLLFPIQVLYLSSVHPTWRDRLWNYTVVLAPATSILVSNDYRRSNKRRRTERHEQLVWPVYTEPITSVTSSVKIIESVYTIFILSRPWLVLSPARATLVARQLFTTFIISLTCVCLIHLG